MNNMIVTLVLETCSVIVKFYEEFRKNLIKQIEDFSRSAEHRTTDVVPSISIFLAQLYSLTQIENFQDTY